MKPLQGKTVLITRDSSQAGSLKDMLTVFGAEVISIPTISIIDPPQWDPFDQAAAQLHLFDWVIFTSINAVTQTAQRLRKLGHQPEKLIMPKIAVVGDQTARQVEKTGWQVEFVPDQFQAEGLAAGLTERGAADKKIWFPRALVARHVLVDELTRISAQVEVTPVYQNAVPIENRDILHDTLKNKTIDWITFTSSSTVTNFFKILDRKPSDIQLPKLASIGTITTRTLHALSLEPEFTADPQNLDGLCQGIVDCESSNQEIST